MLKIRFCATPCRLLGGGETGANGPLLRQFIAGLLAELLGQVALTGTVKGSCVVTLKGPLIPRPALAESSVKYSPRSAYIPKPARTTTFLRDFGLHAIPMRGANIHWRPVSVESLTPLKPNALLFPATTKPIPGSPFARVPNESLARL